MARLRGAPAELPAPDSAWPMLNTRLFGSNEIGGYHIAPRLEALPIDWTAEFGRSAPLHLEIGFNRGKFLLGLAERDPEVNYVGIEVRRRYVWRITNQLMEDEGPRNLRVIWADAKLAAPAVFGEASLDAIYITFPDPWWKKKHIKRRLVDTDFATTLAASLKPGGRIWVKSDVPAISEEISDALASVDALVDRTPFEIDDLPLTHRERSCIEKGMPITRFFYTRAG